jgi:hypothetical protein
MDDVDMLDRIVDRQLRGLRALEADVDLATRPPGRRPGETQRGQLPPPPGEFSGWSAPVPIDSVGQRAGMNVAGFRLYRISHQLRPSNQLRLLYIGMTREGVASRVQRHLAGGGSQRLFGILQGLPRQDVMVQKGRVVNPPATMDMKLLHIYELMLQRKERPADYDPNVWSFEEFEEMMVDFDD